MVCRLGSGLAAAEAALEAGGERGRTERVAGALAGAGGIDPVRKVVIARSAATKQSRSGYTLPVEVASLCARNDMHLRWAERLHVWLP